MMGHTHMIIGGAAWLGVGAAAVATRYGVSAVEVVGGYAVASLAALLPDIDTKNSMIAKSLGPVTGSISWAVRTAFGGHRKITHSLLGLALVALGVAACVGGWHLVPWVGVAVLVGYVSHLLADMSTREGCPLLWPLSMHKFGLHLITTGKRVEHSLVIPLTLALSAGFVGFMAIGG